MNEGNLLKYSDCDNKSAFVETSEFEIYIPSYREEYIKTVSEEVEKMLRAKNLLLNANYGTKILTVSTTKNTRDPYIIIKGRELLRLLCRGMALKEASNILEDSFFCDIIKIDKLVRKSDTLEKRRERLLGKNASMLKALKLLTKCHIEIQGSTVSCIGPHKGVEDVRKIVIETMKNTHPAFLIKQMITKKKLENDETLKEDDWSRYIPPISKQHKRGRRKPAYSRVKKQNFIEEH